MRVAVDDLMTYRALKVMLVSLFMPTRHQEMPDSAAKVQLLSTNQNALFADSFLAVW